MASREWGTELIAGGGLMMLRRLKPLARKAVANSFYTRQFSFPNPPAISCGTGPKLVNREGRSALAKLM